MAHMMKKAEFLALLPTVETPKLKSFRGSVYLYDGDQQVAEIYRASNMREEGIICAMNQSGKYRAWLNSTKR
ncbi:TPA: hypothetical protein QHN36_003527 [Enterobacter bugandensis]|nr:hypothetical protein [Enterobacter bugandensis]